MAYCGLSESQIEKAREDYTALHEGLEPENLICESAPKTPRSLHALGRATEIQYKKKIPGQTPSYHHPWAHYSWDKSAQPTIAADENGQLRFMAGRYETRRRGIEDRVLPGMKTSEFIRKPYVQNEYYPSDVKSLTTLGKLEWIKYIDSRGRIRTLRFAAASAPEIAHDQNGDLHVLNGSYRIVQGEVVVMAHHSRHRAHRRGHRRGHMRHHRRHNPVMLRGVEVSSGRDFATRAGQEIAASLAMGTVGVVEIIGVNKLLSYVTWAPQWKAVTKLAVGLAGGIGLSMVAGRYPSIPAGFAVGGVIDGLKDLYDLYAAPALANIMAPASTTTSATTTTTTTTTAPASYALGAGMVGGYPTYSPQSCGVG